MPTVIVSALLFLIIKSARGLTINLLITVIKMPHKDLRGAIQLAEGWLNGPGIHLCAGFFIAVTFSITRPPK